MTATELRYIPWLMESDVDVVFCKGRAFIREIKDECALIEISIPTLKTLYSRGYIDFQEGEYRYTAKYRHLVWARFTVAANRTTLRYFFRKRYLMAYMHNCLDREPILRLLR